MRDDLAARAGSEDRADLRSGHAYRTSLPRECNVNHLRQRTNRNIPATRQFVERFKILRELNRAVLDLTQRRKAAKVPISLRLGAFA